MSIKIESDGGSVTYEGRVDSIIQELARQAPEAITLFTGLIVGLCLGRDGTVEVSDELVAALDSRLARFSVNADGEVLLEMLDIAEADNG